MGRKYFKYIFLLCFVFLTTIACNQLFSSEQTILTPESESNLTTNALNNDDSDSKILKLWWDKGYNPEEDEALIKLVKNWEQETGKKVQINFYSLDARSQKPERSLKGGNLPDIFMSFKAESTLNPRLAWEGKLVDVSDIIEPVKQNYDPGALQTAFYYNNVDQKQSYYAVPIHRTALHIYYWKDLLQKTGRSEQDIPKDWQGFWQFWLDVAADLKTKHQQDIYPIGLPMSVEAGDTYQMFEHILEAYNISIVDDKGNLAVDDPKVRQGIIDVLQWYDNFYQQGYIPQDAVDWNNAANNQKLLNREILTTSNATLSIPAALRQDPDAYRNKLGIIELPNKPNGKPMRHIFLVEQAVIFADSPHQELAKNFLAYLIQPEVNNKFLKESGRHSPAQKSAYKDTYWSDPKDPHTSAVTKTLTKSNIRPIYPSQTPAYSNVLKENVWGQALEDIALNKVTPEQAADDAIAKIKTIFQQWDEN
jgi:multiple sugar transport system substrate-binding protein